MSYCSLKVAHKRCVKTYQRFQNSWGGHAYIWDSIYKKYLKDPDKPDWQDNWLIMASKHDSKLWHTHEDLSIPQWIRTILVSTWDWSITERDKLPKYAGYLRRFCDVFPSGENAANHLPSWAREIETIYKEKPGCVGICYHATSVSNDVWDGYNPSTGEHFLTFEVISSIGLSMPIDC